MEQHPEVITEQGIVRKSGEVTPFNAGDAMARVMEVYNDPIPRRDRPRLGKAAKELLEDGFAPDVVCLALLRALYRSRIDLCERFAMEVQNAAKGNHLSYAEDRTRLEALSRQRRWESSNDPITTALREEVARELQRR